MKSTGPKPGRRYDRVSTEMQVPLHRGDRLYLGTVHQISLGGAFVEINQESNLQRGDTVTLGLDLGSGTVHQSLPATVIYCLTDYEIQSGVSCAGVGLRFGTLDQPVHDAIERIVSQQREAGLVIYDSKGKRAVESAWRLSHFLRSVVDNAAVLLGVIDERGKVVLWNRAAETITGYSAQDVLDGDQLWTKLVRDSGQRQQMKNLAARVMSSGGAITDHEVVITAEDGSRKVVVWDLRPLMEGDTRIGLIAMGRETTEQREMEELLRQAQRLEAIGRLAGGISHDFNNILTAIMGYCEMLSLEAKGNHDLDAGIDGVMLCADRAAALVRQLLAFSRKQVLRPVPLDLNALITDTEEMLTRLLGSKIVLRTYPADRPQRVMADRVQLEQVVVNLVVNARDAMPGGGTITIEVQTVDLDETGVSRNETLAPGRYVMLTVSDTGRGMDQHTLSHLFEPFFTTKDTGSGTGLGLSTVYGIIKQSGGFTWVYSELGRGSAFKVCLPALPEEDDKPGSGTEPGTIRGGSETILLVEDDNNLRKTLVEALTAAGYTVLEAGNGSVAEAMGARHEDKIDLLLTDIVLPGLDGPYVAERLRRERPQMRVLFVSGYSERVAVADGVLEPGQAFIQKPCRPTAVLQRVRELLDTDPDH